jgi:hypothetical protein
MALPMKGALKASMTEPYVGAEVWGTGINEIHAVYGEGPPLRITGRNGNVPTIQPADARLDETPGEDLWGYDIDVPHNNGDVYIDDRPAWNEVPPDYNANTENHPPWNVAQYVNERFRATSGGAHRISQKLVDSIPSETVSEGWVNKPTGTVANSKPADDAQVFIQTSMMQRYRKRNNKHAVARATDAPRAEIDSRVEGMKVREYSGQVVDSPRYYDMTPYQQDAMLRPFRYRTAGTGPASYLRPNAMTVLQPIERVPPPDPSVGIPEAPPASDYGYTGEDQFYA